MIKLKSIKILALSVIIFLSCAKEESIDFETIRLKTETWKLERLTNLQKPYGWLSLVGFHWLGFDHNGSDEFLSVDGINYSFLKMQNTIFGAPKDSAEMLQILYSKKSDTTIQNTIYQDSSIQWFVIERDGKFAIRVKDSLADSRKNFNGLDYFEFNKDFVFLARLEKVEEPFMLSFPNKMGYIEEQEITHRIDFEYNGKWYSLNPLIEGDKLFIIYADKTNGKSTYEACRYLYADLPKEREKFILNFNESFNPPCVFTEFATCPLPPEKNFLPFEVKAGEKKYH